MNRSGQTVSFTLGVVFLCFLFAFSANVARAEEPGKSVYGTYGTSDECVSKTGFVPLECFKGSAKLEDAYNTEELGPFMSKVFVGAISLGAILAVLRLAWAGFSYMSSDLWSTKEKSKEIIQDTLLGLFLLLAIWLILHQINPQILSLEITTNKPETIMQFGQGPRGDN